MNGIDDRRSQRTRGILASPEFVADVAGVARRRGQSISDVLTVAVLLHVREPRAEAVVEGTMASMRRALVIEPEPNDDGRVSICLPRHVLSEAISAATQRGQSLGAFLADAFAGLLIAKSTALTDKALAARAATLTAGAELDEAVHDLAGFGHPRLSVRSAAFPAAD